ncbi:MAG: hypothetical protein AAF617_14690 [Bacteroidota bacterium]
MKKQKFSLQLRKQKIAILSEKQVQGGIEDTGAVTIATTVPFSLFQVTCVTQQITCKSLLINCDPMPTLPSGCGCPTTHTNTIDAPSFITC